MVRGRVGILHKYDDISLVSIKIYFLLFSKMDLLKGQPLKNV